MTINIAIFSKNIRPIENLLGLIQMAEAASVVDRITIIGKIEKKYTSSEHQKVFFVDNLDIRKLKNYSLVFGLSTNYALLKMLNLITNKQIFVSVGPGKITKAIGLYKHPKRAIRKKIMGYIKYLLPNFYYVAEDFEDAMYLSTAYGRDISFYKPIGLPKKINIGLELSKKKTSDKIGILFVPTHRWPGKQSTITNWLGNERFINKLRNYNVYYNNHPDEMDTVVCDQVIETKKMPTSIWRNVDILVTDYSSIAHDYISAGGKNVINVTADLIEFEQNQGKSPLPLDKQFPGLRCETKEEFFRILFSFKDFSKQKIEIIDYSDNWFKSLMHFR